MRVSLLALVLAVLAGFSFVTPVAAWDSNSYSLPDEQLLFNLTNQARASAGLPVLRNDSYLVGAARWRSKDMIVRNYFSHNIPPSGELVFAQMQRDGYCFSVAGENIGVSTWGDDVATTRIQNAFMNSPDHRANILGKTWTNMGVGTYKGADGKKIWTVLFSVPCAAPAPAPAATPKPTPKPTPRPTARPIVVTAPPAPKTLPPTPAPTAAPTDTPTPAPTDTPTLAPTDTPTAVPASTPTVEPTEPVIEPPTGSNSQSLRVRAPARSDSWLDSIFRTLFGGVFG